MSAPLLARHHPDPGRALLFVPSFGDGGVERMMVNIARGLSATGSRVDFITRPGPAPYLDRLPPEVNHITLEPGARASQTALVRYLLAARPEVLLSAKLDDDELALRCRAHAGVPTRIVVRVGTTFSAHGRGALRAVKQWRRNRLLRRLYRQVDGILCVSEGVAEDLSRGTGIPRSRMRVVPNPVVTPELLSEAGAALAHPWFRPGEPPVILGVGRLGRAKNFPLLIRAFARVRAGLPCRLMILGEGGKRPELERLARRLGVADEVALPGFVANPYAYLARARVFALSSDVEGSPNALVEALAVGTPVVATDCPSGPREILEGGRVAPLVPCGSEEALAAAVSGVLREPPPADGLRRAAARYTLLASARAYRDALGLGEGRADG